MQSSGLSLMEGIDRVRSHIASGGLGEALRELRTIAPQLKTNQGEKIIFLSALQAEFEKKIRIGIISREDAYKSLIQIASDILSLISEINLASEYKFKWPDLSDIKRIVNLIEQAETQEVISILMDVTAKADNFQRDEALLISFRYEIYKKDVRMGTISSENSSVILSNIVLSVLNIVTALEAGPVPSAEPVEAPTFRTESRKKLYSIKFDKIIGVNNLKQIGWIEHGVSVSRAVCRILTPTGLATGFLIDGAVIMTNNHVIPSEDIARETRVEFNYQIPFGSFAAQAISARYNLAPELLYCTSTELDYTVVAVNTKDTPGRPPVSAWGKVLLNPQADPIRNEHVVIVQHPNGQPKQIVLNANAVLEVETPYLRYSTDTMPGSSGSPVFNDLWQVIAIHHAAGPPLETFYGEINHSNEGILMSAVYADLCDRLKDTKPSFLRALLSYHPS